MTKKQWLGAIFIGIVSGAAACISSISDRANEVRTEERFNEIEARLDSMSETTESVED